LSIFAHEPLVIIWRSPSNAGSFVLVGERRVDDSQTDSCGEHDRLAGLIEDYQRRLYLYIYSLVHRVEDTHDVLQETNLALWRDADRVEAVADFRSWAFRVAFNQVLAYRKRRVRDRLQFDEALVIRLAEDMQGQIDETTHQQAALRSCARKLPDGDRRMLAMRYASALSVRLIAEQLGSTVAAVSKSLYRIRVALRKCIREVSSGNSLE
jgi:RNA polymerase sigma-70 factor, ECF subfamily